MVDTEKQLQEEIKRKIERAFNNHRETKLSASLTTKVMSALESKRLHASITASLIGVGVGLTYYGKLQKQTEDLIKSLKEYGSELSKVKFEDGVEAAEQKFKESVDTIETSIKQLGEKGVEIGAEAKEVFAKIKSDYPELTNSILKVDSVELVDSPDINGGRTPVGDGDSPAPPEGKDMGVPPLKGDRTPVDFDNSPMPPEGTNGFSGKKDPLGDRTPVDTDVGFAPEKPSGSAEPTKEAAPDPFLLSITQGVASSTKSIPNFSDLHNDLKEYGGVKFPDWENTFSNNGQFTERGMAESMIKMDAAVLNIAANMKPVQETQLTPIEDNKPEPEPPWGNFALTSVTIAPIVIALIIKQTYDTFIKPNVKLEKLWQGQRDLKEMTPNNVFQNSIKGFVGNSGDLSQEENSEILHSMLFKHQGGVNHLHDWLTLADNLKDSRIHRPLLEKIPLFARKRKEGFDHENAKELQEVEDLLIQYSLITAPKGLNAGVAEAVISSNTYADAILNVYKQDRAAFAKEYPAVNATIRTALLSDKVLKQGRSNIFAKIENSWASRKREYGASAEDLWMRGVVTGHVMDTLLSTRQEDHKIRGGVRNFSVDLQKIVERCSIPDEEKKGVALESIQSVNKYTGGDKILSREKLQNHRSQTQKL
ncbi:hypothetical protein [Vibrio crassostreae]|uniref:hypothetical protein n=1 Tax=Vibrio crassostreae TaxID=246167 RepID=UPI001B30DFBD|nr:hypothetical protein [Vibrio crassostreae]